MGGQATVLAGWLLLVVGAFPLSALAQEAVPSADTASASAQEATVDEAPKEDRPALVFTTKCAGCHTIGSGALSGPDLKTASTYPRQTVLDAIKKMEKNVGPLSAEEVEQLAELVLDPHATARIEEQRKLMQLRELATLEPGNAEKGKGLFFGKPVFINGAVACAACHQAGGRGGNLAASLEDAFRRLGEQSLISTAENPGFPVMRAIYQGHPVSKQEARHLVAFLQAVSAGAPQKQILAPMHFAGLAGVVALMLALGRATRRRAAGTRARMVAESYGRGNRGCRCGGK